ncbi:MAG: hypothetical protein HYX32_05910 [Actinobacteria bacterium]|nr:hypothetical protein [Actinomycetota bacterium]
MSDETRITQLRFGQALATRLDAFVLAWEAADEFTALGLDAGALPHGRHRSQRAG